MHYPAGSMDCFIHFNKETNMIKCVGEEDDVGNGQECMIMRDKTTRQVVLIGRYDEPFRIDPVPAGVFAVLYC